MTRYALFIVGVLSLLFSLVPILFAGEPGFQGRWVSPPGAHQEVLQLEERDGRVLGTYGFIRQDGISFEGTLEAVREGTRLRGTWREHPVNRPQALTQGAMELRLDAGGNRVEGWYGNADGSERTPWVMIRK